MKRTGSARKTSRSRTSSPKRPTPRVPGLRSTALRYVVCVDTGGYSDLETLKVYRVKADKQALAMGLLRVVDASGEDYLYPAEFFQPISASPRLFDRLKQTA